MCGFRSRRPGCQLEIVLPATGMVLVSTIVAVLASRGFHLNAGGISAQPLIPAGFSATASRPDVLTAVRIRPNGKLALDLPAFAIQFVELFRTLVTISEWVEPADAARRVGATCHSVFHQFTPRDGTLVSEPRLGYLRTATVSDAKLDLVPW
jgi:hypothetical protein